MRLLLIVCFSCICVSSSDAKPITDSEREFFEAKIRPILIEHCYQCHNSVDSAEGGFVLDHRDGILRGGDRGPVADGEKPAESLLIKVLRHEIDGLEMPEGGPKLDESMIRDFEHWIRIGLPDPRDTAPTDDQLRKVTSWEETLSRRKAWWSFQPIVAATPPNVDVDSQNPIDHFLDTSLRSKGLQASPPADAATIVRRLYFTLIGLPPSGDLAARWTKRIDHAVDRDAVIEELVDELLDSPRFGERWARHWMDWIRYAESHGSEGDPAIDGAWHYRDYLIRALNQDVPYDQLLREHVAGDLLTSPRIDSRLGVNESAIATAHWRMVFHGFAPTDALDEKVRFIDDQINVFSKAFLGMTVSCARCHDHKFDAISQADYYALFGVLGSCRPGRTVVDLPAERGLHRESLADLKRTLRDAVASKWIDRAAQAVDRLLESDPSSLANATTLKELQSLCKKVESGSEFEPAWETLVNSRLKSISDAEAFFDQSQSIQWNLARESDRDQWYRYGVGLDNESNAGQFSIAAEGPRILTGVYPSGVYTHGLSNKHPGRLTSPDIDLSSDQMLWVQVIGDMDASLRYVVQDYPRSGTVYPVTKLNDQWRWQRFDLAYWDGDSIHVELATAMDAPLLTSNQPRSWFGVRKVIVADKDLPTPDATAEGFLPIVEAAKANPPHDLSQLKRVLQSVIEHAVKAWGNDSANDGQSILLDECLRAGLLPNTLDQLPSLADSISQYRRLENAIAVPTRVPGLEETIGVDQRMMIRGNHKNMGEPVRRRFLEAIDDAPYETSQSGRIELANDLLRDDNPLTKRVIVNRIWHHVFGRGIVATPDNFGRLGSTPTHPELLDWLADRFAADGWSIKKIIRLLVTSDAFQRSSVPQPGVDSADPENLYLAHAHVRRMEAEAIRDSLLTVSGQLDNRLYGRPAAASSPRRSVYVRVIRNALDPFLRVFDFPEPFSAVGRRDVTNVPAQSLAMMNDAQIAGYADAWARRVKVKSESQNAGQGIAEMFLDAFGRAPTQDEITRAESFLNQMNTIARERSQQRETLESQISEINSGIDLLLAEARSDLEQEVIADSQTPQIGLPEPIGRWDFTKSLEDQIGNADASLHNGAIRDERGLTVNGSGYALTGPIGVTLRQKTMEVWVRLSNLDQRGGGVMTIQTSDGRVFDAIVFGERDPREWLAGSNNFARTEPFGGPKEESADREPVHIVITYDSQGNIAGYRDGKAYGSTYPSSGPQPFAGEDSIIGFGVRHLPAGGNRLLSGTILQANLYDRSLSAEEVSALASGSKSFVSEEVLLARLTEQQRESIADDRHRIAGLRRELQAIPESKLSVQEQAWSELARAFLSFKEFIYVR